MVMEGTMNDTQFETWHDATYGIARKRDGTPRVGVMEARERMRAAWRAALAAPVVLCKWTEDSDSNWDTECGKMWTFTDGGPLENDVKYCHGCGKRVEVVAYVEEIANDDDS